MSESKGNGWAVDGKRFGEAEVASVLAFIASRERTQAKECAPQFAACSDASGIRMRMVDRTLQILKRRGLIEKVGTRWWKAVSK